MDQAFTVRAPRDEDLAGVLALNHAHTREIGLEPTEGEADVRNRWSHPRVDRERHDRVVEIDGQIVASAGLWLEDHQAHGGGFVAPGFRGRGIGRALQDWLRVTARAEPGISEYHTWADVKTPGAIELITSLPGASYERSFIRMINRSPGATAEPVWPDGTKLLPLEGDALIDAVIEAHDGSFIDHWNFISAKREDVVHDLEHPDEDPALWFVAVADDGRIAGFNLCHYVERNGVRRGFLGPIGTTRPFRRIGLARALLRHGVLELAARGATEVILGVDADNPNQALGLYERNGFVVIGEGRVYRVSL